MNTKHPTPSVDTAMKIDGPLPKVENPPVESGPVPVRETIPAPPIEQSIAPPPPVQSFPENSGPSVADLLEQMRRDNEARDRRHREELDALRSQNTARDLELAQLRQRVADPLAAAAIKPPSNYAEKVTSSVNEQYARQAKADADLLEGPTMFLVTMPNEPRMERKVGGHSKAEALGKWREYFNVTGHIPEKAVTANEIPREEPLPPVS